MSRYFILYISFLLASAALYAQEPFSTVYLDAQGIINKAKSSNKPYSWFVMYVPKCNSATELFTERIQYYNQIKDKVDLTMLAIVKSKSNVDSFLYVTKLNNFTAPYYVIDTVYKKDDIQNTHFELMKHLSDLFGVQDEIFVHLVLDKKGQLVLRDEDDKKIRRKLKKLLN